MSKEIASTRALDPIAEARRQWEAHGWSDSASGMAAVTTIVRVNQILVSEVETALQPHGLTFARFEILRLLGFSRTGRLPMGKISDRLQVHPASVTSAVKRLERDGLIDRRTDEDDNRVVLAGILENGRQVLERATTSVNRVFASISLDEQQIETMIGILDHIRYDAGDFTELK